MKKEQTLKTEATRAELRRVYQNYQEPRDIVLEMKNGAVWIRKVWSNPSGRFGWGRWQQVH